MSKSFKVSVPQLNPAVAAVRMSKDFPAGSDPSLPTTINIVATSALTVYILHSAETNPEQFPTCADVLTNGYPITSTQPLRLTTTEMDNPQKSDASSFFLAVSTGASAGEIRVFG